MNGVKKIVYGRSDRLSFFRFHRNVQLRIIIIFINNLVTNMIFPFMTIYMADKFGVSNAGYILLISTIFAILGNLWGGQLSDKIGRKKIMVYTELIKIIIFIGFMIGTSNKFFSPILISLCFIMRNFFNGLYSPASEAMLLDVSLPNERKDMFRMIYWINNLSLAFGAVLGSVFFKNYMSQLFLILTIISIIIMIVTVVFINETFKIDRTSKSVEKIGYRIVMKDKVFVLYFLANILIFSVETNFTKFISVTMQKNSYVLFGDILKGSNFYGLLLAVNTGLIVVLSIVISFWKKEKDFEKLLFILGSFLYLIGYSILPILSNAYILILIMFMITLGEIIFAPLFQQYLGDIAVKEYRGSYVAVNKLSYRFSTLISSCLLMIFSKTSIEITTVISFFIGVMGFIISLKIVPLIELRKKEN